MAPVTVYPPPSSAQRGREQDDALLAEHYLSAKAQQEGKQTYGEAVEDDNAQLRIH